MQLISNLYACLVLACAILTPLAHACTPPNASSEPFEVGNDTAADPATLGYTFNHFALLVNDLEETMHFYGKVLGMRTIFKFQASPTFYMAYMGMSHGGKNGTGFQSGQDLYNEKNNIEGLIEFIQPANCSDPDSPGFLPSIKRVNTFSHIGLIVPDVMATQTRMKNFGVKILKTVGTMPVPGTAAGELLEKAFGIQTYTEEEQANTLKGIKAIGFDRFLVATDPDGNVLEIQQQESVAV